MSRTYRKNMDSVLGSWRKNATKIEKTRKPISPQNKPSKRYQMVEEAYYSFHEYDTGNQFGHGHKTCHALNQSLNQKVRTIEKRKFKKELDNILNENNY